MANRLQRWEDNAAGAWYVDRECILCNICIQLSPENFSVSEAGDHDIVYKQPEGAQELALCEEALEQCPVDSIGCNG